MTTKFSEDLVPLTDLKVNPGRVVKHTTEERAFMRAVVAGLADLEAGREVSLDETKVRLGLK